jgi:hypothetical protein
MALYEYDTWTGVKKVIEADKVAFKPGHVLFLTLDDQLILGERNANVNHLRQVTEPETL